MAVRLTDERWSHIRAEHPEFGSVTGWGEVWSSYDREDVVYVKSKTADATASELIDDDVILRYEGEELTGLTILRASER